MAPLSRGLELLESAVSYALAGAEMAIPQILLRPTPCPGWDLQALLDHLSDSIGVLAEVITGASVSAVPPGYPGPEPDPVARLRGQAAGLLGAWAAAGPAERRVASWDRELTASMVAVAGAIEITVHGWDISVACGDRRPVPPGLAAVLLPIAPLLITPGTRPGLFADPVRLPGPACPGDLLVAFLGRQPRPPGARESGWSMSDVSYGGTPGSGGGLCRKRAARFVRQKESKLSRTAFRGRGSSSARPSSRQTRTYQRSSGGWVTAGDPRGLTVIGVAPGGPRRPGC